MSRLKNNPEKLAESAKQKAITVLKLFTIAIIFLGCGEDDGQQILTQDDFDHSITSKTNVKAELQIQSQEDLSTNGVASVQIQLDGTDIVEMVDVIQDTPFFQTIVFDGLTPDTQYDYTIKFEDSNGELFITSVGGGFKTFPTIPTPEITGTEAEKHWPGSAVVFTGENLSFEPFGGEEVFLGEFEASGSPDGIFIPDNMPEGLYAVSMKFVYHEITTDPIIRVVHQEISSIEKGFDSERTYSGGNLTIYGDNFHPEKDKNEVYLGGGRALVTEAFSDSLKVKIAGFPTGGSFDPGNYTVLSLKIGSLEVESPIVVTVVPRPWANINQMPFHNYDGGLFEVDGKAYLVGGIDGDGGFSDKLWEYDPSVDSWVEKLAFPGGGRTGGVALSLSGKGYFGLGQSDSETYNMDWWVYDPTTNTWSQLGDFEGGGLLYGAGFSINDIGYVGTGVSEGNLRKGDFWKYSATTDAWIRIADYPAGEERASSTTMDGKAYVGFGNDGSLQPNNKLYEYSPELDEWSFITSDPHFSRSDGTLYALDGKVYSLGGFNENGHSTIILTEYTVSSDMWELKSSMLSSRDAAVGIVYNEKIITMGGRTIINNSSVATQLVRQYSPENELN